MALAIPLSISLGTLISLLVSAGKLAYDGGTIAIDGVEHTKTKSSRCLVQRCSECVEDLQQIDHHILITGRSHRVVQVILDNIKWCSKYDSKCLLKRIVFNGTYRKKFEKCHHELSQYYYDFVLSVLITKLYPDVLTNSLGDKNQDILLQ